jgi:hypothetical protein
VTKVEDQDPILLAIRFHSKSLEDFIEDYYSDVLQGGIFIRTATIDPLLRLGSHLRFRFETTDGRTLFAGSGLVAWIHRAPRQMGVGIQFKHLSPTSQLVYQEMLAKREELDRRTRTGRRKRRVTEEFAEAPTLPFGPTPLFS